MVLEYTANVLGKVVKEIGTIANTAIEEVKNISSAFIDGYENGFTIHNSNNCIDTDPKNATEISIIEKKKNIINKRIQDELR